MDGAGQQSQSTPTHPTLPRSGGHFHSEHSGTAANVLAPFFAADGSACARTSTFPMAVCSFDTHSHAAWTDETIDARRRQEHRTVDDPIPIRQPASPLPPRRSTVHPVSSSRVAVRGAATRGEPGSSQLLAATKLGPFVSSTSWNSLSQRAQGQDDDPESAICRGIENCPQCRNQGPLPRREIPHAYLAHVDGHTHTHTQKVDLVELVIRSTGWSLCSTFHLRVSLREVASQCHGVVLVGGEAKRYHSPTGVGDTCTYPSRAECNSSPHRLSSNLVFPW